MKGIIFNVAEEVVTDLYGADAWDSLLASAELEGAYTSLGNYDDAEIAAIIAAAAVLLDVGLDGRVMRARMSKPAGFGIDEACIAAWKQSRWKPGKKDEVPVGVTRIPRKCSIKAVD